MKPISIIKIAYLPRHYKDLVHISHVCNHSESFNSLVPSFPTYNPHVPSPGNRVAVKGLVLYNLVEEITGVLMLTAETEVSKAQGDDVVTSDNAPAFLIAERTPRRNIFPNSNRILVSKYIKHQLMNYWRQTTYDEQS